MITELGRVIKVEDGFAWVETSVKSSCSSCAAKGNCGTSAVAEAVAGKTVVNKVNNDLGAELGDQVEIGIEEDTLIYGAFYLYLVPLITAIVFALISQFWLVRFFPINEGIVILSTFVGGIMGFYFSKHKLQSVGADRSVAKLLKIKFKAIDVTQV